MRTRPGGACLTAAAGDQAARETLVKELTARGLVDFDGLIELAVALLSAHPDAAGGLRRRWPMISIDEYQDIDAAQYELLRLLAGDGAGLTAIGDPDQAIYGFRGGDVGFFLRFGQDYPAAATRQLSVSYRSGRPIVAAAAAAVAPATLVPGRRLQAVASARRSPRTRRPTSTPRRPGSAPRSTSCSAAPRSTPWTAAGPAATATPG